ASWWAFSGPTRAQGFRTAGPTARTAGSSTRGLTAAKPGTNCAERWLADGVLGRVSAQFVVEAMGTIRRRNGYGQMSRAHGQMSHPELDGFGPRRRWAKSVGILTRFALTARTGKTAWCCESCRKAALRHGQDGANLGSDAPPRPLTQTASELRLSREPAP